MKNLSRVLLRVGLGLSLGLVLPACVAGDDLDPAGGEPGTTGGAGRVGATVGGAVSGSITRTLDDCFARVNDACLTIEPDAATCDFVAQSACAEPMTLEACDDAVHLAAGCWSPTISDAIADLACAAEAPAAPPASTPIADCHVRVAEACHSAVADDGGWMCESAAQQVCDWTTPVREAMCAWDVTSGLEWVGFTVEQIADIAALTCEPQEASAPITACAERVTAACLAEFPDSAELCAQLGTDACDPTPSETSCAHVVTDTCTSFCWAPESCAAIAADACAAPCGSTPR